MPITITTVSTPKELKRFIRFNYHLYRNNPYAVPELYSDMLDTFNPKKNAAYEFSEAELYTAYKDGRLVGRVAAIINHRANETWQTKVVRFGWIDFIDDMEVSAALLDAVAAWGKQRGMTTMEGPFGFTDMDPEGTLIEGFDQLGTMATIYNDPYYPTHFEHYGLSKATDWLEFRIHNPKETPEKMMRVAQIVSKKYGLHVKKVKNMREINRGGYGQKIFDLLNECYAPLYGFSKLSQRQVDQYVKMYLPMLDLRMLTLIENDAEELIGFGIAMPSLSVALQKARGRYFPFGWFHLLKSLYWKRSNILDLLLVGIKPSYQGKGVNSLIFLDMIPNAVKLGFEWSEGHPQLETNTKVQQQWDYFETKQNKRRRAYRKELRS